MKHLTKRILAFVLALAMTGGLLYVSAAGEADNRVVDLAEEEGYTLTLLDANDNVLTKVSDQVGEGTMDVYKNVAKIKVNFTGETSQQYVVFLLSGNNENDDLEPSKFNIAYIDQKPGEANMEFVIYPYQLADGTDYAIRISDLNGLKTAGSFKTLEPEYKLGDVDGSKEVNVGDVTRLLRHLANLTTSEDVVNLKAADVDGSKEVNVGDATKLLRVLAGLDPAL